MIASRAHLQGRLRHHLRKICLRYRSKALFDTRCGNKGRGYQERGDWWVILIFLIKCWDRGYCPEKCFPRRIESRIVLHFSCVTCLLPMYICGLKGTEANVVVSAVLWDGDSSKQVRHDHRMWFHRLRFGTSTLKRTLSTPAFIPQSMTGTLAKIMPPYLQTEIAKLSRIFALVTSRKVCVTIRSIVGHNSLIQPLQICLSFVLTIFV